jgi:SAM-dependent methyltransferase
VSTSAAFSGAVAGNYDRFLGPALFEPYAADLIVRIPREEDLRVLEVACGTGIVTRRLREALPASASIVATDLNEPMLEHARAAVPLSGITWQQADAQELPFEDGSFDVYACQFGLMFLPDKVRGLREARRVLAPGGLLVANVWESGASNSHVPPMQAALDRRFPDSPPTFLDVPHGYNDLERIRSDLDAAGWEDATIESVRLPSSSPTALDFATGFAAGSPLTHELAARGADPVDVAAEMANELAGVGGDAPFAVELGALVISGRR